MTYDERLKRLEKQRGIPKLKDILVIKMKGLRGKDPSDNDPPELKRLNEGRSRKGLKPYHLLYVCNEHIAVTLDNPDNELEETP